MRQQRRWAAAWLLTTMWVGCGNDTVEGHVDAGTPEGEGSNDAGGSGDDPVGGDAQDGSVVEGPEPVLDAGSSDGGEAHDAGIIIADPGTDGDGNYTIGPDYQKSPDLEERDVPHGEVFTFYMSSEDSKLYDGFDDTLNNPQSFSRKVEVYIPAQYVDGTEAPVIVVHDGPGYTYFMKTALDNLIADQRLPAIVAIMVDNGGGDSIGSQRGLEYDTMSDRYARFIEEEVFPAVLVQEDIAAAYPNLTITENPEGRATMGCSSGGAAALTMGWFRPDLFHRIFTYSGTFVDQQNPEAAEEQEYPLGAWEYHERLIEESAKKPLRIFIQAAEHDLGENNDEASHHNWKMANDRMAEDLANKGYHYRYLYSAGAYHCDGRVRDQTLPETLLWLWRGYPLD